MHSIYQVSIQEKVGVYKENRNAEATTGICVLWQSCGFGFKALQGVGCQ